MMMNDQDFDRLLKTYRVPTADPTMAAQALQAALDQKRRPAAPARTPWMFFRSPVFLCGSAMAAAAAVLLALPMTDGYNVEAVISDITHSERLAENEINSATEIFSLLESGSDQQIENLPDSDGDKPIWDIFMGQT